MARKKKKNPCVFLDVSIGDDHAGEMVFELFVDVVPKTAENFRALCTGEMGVGKTTISPLYYRGTRFHKIVKGFMAQGGDFSKKDGTGGESIYGGTFADENFSLLHDDRGLLSMANTGPHTNGSQFFITFKPAPHLDRKNVVFGKLILGDDVLNKIEHVHVDGTSPAVRVKIVNCGMRMESADLGSLAGENDEVKAGGQYSEQKLRSHEKGPLQGRDSSISPRRGPIKRINLKGSVSQSTANQRHCGTPIHPVESCRSTSPTRQSISTGSGGRSPSRSSSRSVSRSPNAPLSRSRSRNTSPSNAQTRRFNGRSGRHLSCRTQGTSPEVSPVRRSMGRSRSVSGSPVMRSRRRRSRSRSRGPRGDPQRSQKSSHVRSSGRSSIHSPTLDHRSHRISRDASPPYSCRARSPSSGHGTSPSRSGSSDGAPKRVRKGRGFTRRYSFVRRYQSPTPDGRSVRSDHYGGRNTRDRYARYHSSRYHRRYKSSSRERASPRLRNNGYAKMDLPVGI